MTILQFIRASFIKPLPRINIWKSILLNFSVLPFRQAIHLPIHLYGKWNLRVLHGRIIIPLDQAKFGAFVFGYDIAGYFTSLYNTLSLHQGSKIDLAEGVRMGQGVQLCLYPDAILKMKRYSSLGDNVKIIARKEIEIGEKTDVTWDCSISDFNSHYIIDSNKRSISNITKPVFIGDYCWLCNRTVVMPGTILPNRTIVASNSLLNKDYIKSGIPEKAMIGGSPAKVIKTGLYRIYSRENENWLKQHFKENPADDIYEIEESSKFEE